MRNRTIDRQAPQSLRFYTVEQLGEKQSLTPEGFLLCEDVPIARTGTMVYGPNETPLAAGPDGIVRVHREEDEVFRPEYIASYVGKPVVNDHPDDDVTPGTWRELAIGVVLNPRRGSGIQADLLIADFLITTEEGIKAVRSGKVEVSCGYDADYEELGPGEGRQCNMIGNHVALVEAGRCGNRCSIGDSKPNSQGGSKMVTKVKKGGVLDRMLKAFGAKDADELVEKLKEGETEDEGLETSGSGETHIHIHNGEVTPAAEAEVNDEDPLAELVAKNDADHAEFRQRLEALEAALAARQTGDEGDPENLPEETMDALEEEAPEGTTKDSIKKARDSAFLEDSFQQTVAEAEILVPGIQVPTFDRAAGKAKGLDQICSFRRKALDLAYATQDGRAMIDQFHGKPLELSGMKCNQVRTLFKGVVALKKAANNQVRDNRGSGAGSEVKGGVTSLAELNARNAAHYAAKNK